MVRPDRKGYVLHNWRIEEVIIFGSYRGRVNYQVEYCAEHLRNWHGKFILRKNHVYLDKNDAGKELIRRMEKDFANKEIMAEKVARKLISLMEEFGYEYNKPENH